MNQICFDLLLVGYTLVIFIGKLYYFPLLLHSVSQVPSTGSMLCEALLMAYDGHSTSSQDCRGTSGEKELISGALALLLACSGTGKQTALKCMN